MPEAPPPVTPAETAPTQVTTTYNGTPAAVQTTVQGAQPDSAKGGETPPWERNGQAFDPARAWQLIQNLERERDEFRGKVTEHEQAALTELEKAQKAAQAAAERAERAERDALVRQVALDKGLPKGLAGRLQGKTQAELEADADELLKLVPAGPTGPRPDPTQGASQTPPVRGADLGLAEARKRFGDRVKQ
jgi:hypothetical protein